MKVIIAGCGFLGEAAAVLFLEAGWEVLGICATEASAARLAKGSAGVPPAFRTVRAGCPRSHGLQGAQPSPFQVAVMDIASDPVFDDHWKSPDLMVHCASSGGGGVEAYDRVYRMGLERLIAAARPERIVFAGSTSVYGQTDGSWVDERSEAQPLAATGRVLLEAERIALDHSGVVLRFSGLYGPGRSVLLGKYLSGTAVIEAGGNRWINQIHRDDAAAAIVSGATLDPGIYNVSDDTPTSQQEVYSWIAGHCGGDLPPPGEPDRPRKRGASNKRVSNAKLRSTGWTPRYPSYRDALPSLCST